MVSGMVPLVLMILFLCNEPTEAITKEMGARRKQERHVKQHMWLLNKYRRDHTFTNALGVSCADHSPAPCPQYTKCNVRLNDAALYYSNFMVDHNAWGHDNVNTIFG